ncbi:MAG: hypothetical protein P8Y84_13570 [Desulfuromonadales bacterium]
MMRKDLPLLPLFLLLIVLAGCASKSPSGGEIKTGLHVDAVLEFVIEYPIGWRKDRRLAFGQDAGEVRWNDPVEEDTSLRVTSHPRPPADATTLLQDFRAEHPELETTEPERVTLPAAEAWQMHGTTPRQEVQLYLLADHQRRYTIALWTLPGQLDQYDALLIEIAQSFKVLGHEETIGTENQ